MTWLEKLCISVGWLEKITKRDMAVSIWLRCKKRLPTPSFLVIQGRIQDRIQGRVQGRIQGRIQGRFRGRIEVESKAESKVSGGSGEGVKLEKFCEKKNCGAIAPQIFFEAVSVEQVRRSNRCDGRTRNFPSDVSCHFLKVFLKKIISRCHLVQDLKADLLEFIVRPMCGFKIWSLTARCD